MDMAPAAAEAAVEGGAVVEAACVQQYAAAAAWVWQRAACISAAAGSGGWGNDCNGRHAASVWAAAGSRCGVHATACSGSSMCAAVGGSGRQHDCNGIQGWQWPAGGTIAMGSGSGGSAKDGGTAEKLQ